MEATRKWIEQAIAQGDDIYLVVGYYTTVDAQIVQGGAIATNSSARLDVPVAASLAAAGVVVPMTDLLDAGFAGHNRHDERVQRRFVATGEQVCAVQYRKVRFKWFSSHDLAKAALDRDNRWKVYWNVRSQETRKDDVLEADLQDELELENDHEKSYSETEEIYF